MPLWNDLVVNRESLTTNSLIAALPTAEDHLQLTWRDAAQGQMSHALQQHRSVLTVNKEILCFEVQAAYASPSRRTPEGGKAHSRGRVWGLPFAHVLGGLAYAGRAASNNLV